MRVLVIKQNMWYHNWLHLFIYCLIFFFFFPWNWKISILSDLHDTYALPNIWGRSRGTFICWDSNFSKVQKFQYNLGKELHQDLGVWESDIMCNAAFPACFLPILWWPTLNVHHIFIKFYIGLKITYTIIQPTFTKAAKSTYNLMHPPLKCFSSMQAYTCTHIKTPVTYLRISVV